MERSPIHFIQDILQAMNNIEEYIGNASFEDFKKNRMAVDAVIRNLEVIGEASKNIPEEIRNKYSQVPWKKMIGLRNLVSHEYFGIDYENIWEIVKKNIPSTKTDIEEMLKHQ